MSTQVVWFPCEEERLNQICQSLKIQMSQGINCYIVDINNRELSGAIKENYCNIDELNFLTKRLESFDTKEKKQFFASALATQASTMADVINLTYNTHCYSVISDFSNLNEVGKEMYLNERGGASVRELNELDGKAFVEEILLNNLNPTVTPYGVLYKNSNEPKHIYDGKHFPCYQWKNTIATLELISKGEREFVYMPCSNAEIDKALMRLKVDNLAQCERGYIESEYFPDRMIDILTQDESVISNINSINKFAKKLEEMGRHDGEYFEKLLDYVNPKTEQDLNMLIESMYEFEMFDGIESAEQYGRYMICDCGHFEYDLNLEEYIDFKGYGEQKIENEQGAFAPKGYITYYGYNQNLQKLLFENLGMAIDRTMQSQELKLYMPLKITTFMQENDYGNIEKVDYEDEISPTEAITFTDKILEAIEKSSLPEEKQRGLMKYYNEYDSVNAKISNYVFSAEEVNGELMGVAVLTISLAE